MMVFVINNIYKPFYYICNRKIEINLNIISNL